MILRSVAFGICRARRSRLALAVALPALVGALWSCGGNEAALPAPVAEPTQSDTRSALESLVHEKCDESGNRVEATDANNDGKPDIRRIFDARSGAELCRASDLTHDGKSEMFEYFDAAGTLRRREVGFDRTEAIGAVELFESGKLVKRLLDTTGQRHVDTWDTFDPATGKRTKRERDTTSDGKVDQWWTFNDDGTTTIASDRNNDGQPDTDAVVTLNAAGSLVAPDAGATTAASDAGAAAPPPPPPPPPVLMPEIVAPPADAGADSGQKKTAPAGAKAKGSP